MNNVIKVGESYINLAHVVHVSEKGESVRLITIANREHGPYVILFHGKEKAEFLDKFREAIGEINAW